MKVEIEPYMYRVRLYGNHPDNPVGNLQVMVMGDEGYLHSLSGKGFYQLAPTLIQELQETLGLVCVRMHVTRAHAVLLRRMLGNQVCLEVRSSGAYSRDNMVHVTARALPMAGD